MYEVKVVREALNLTRLSKYLFCSYYYYCVNLCDNCKSAAKHFFHISEGLLLIFDVSNPLNPFYTTFPLLVQDHTFCVYDYVNVFNFIH